MPTTESVDAASTPALANDRSPARGAAREHAILAAAVALLREVGYDRLTTDLIAKRAQASKATLYRKWPSKAEIVAEALRRQAEAELACIPDTGSTRDDVLVAMDGICATIVGDGGPSMLGLIEAVREDPALRDLVRSQIVQQSTQTGALIVEHARQRNEVIRIVRPDRLLELTVAHLFMTTLLNGKPPSRREQEAFVDTVILPLLTGAELI